jgi:hypothetical protein
MSRPIQMTGCVGQRGSPIAQSIAMAANVIRHISGSE